jgi:Leucine-rich repeat (LRR) protein
MGGSRTTMSAQRGILILARISIPFATRWAALPTLSSRLSIWLGRYLRSFRFYRIAIYRINLRFNELTGTLPAEYGALSKMDTLILSTNNLSGSMPGEISQWSSLNNFDVSNNEFHGQLPFYSWPSLNFYSAGANEFSGSVPELVGFSSQLRSLSIPQNRLNRSIPTTVGNLQELTQLSLSHNTFTGLPSELGLLDGLRKLTITNCSTGATFPTELFSLSNLCK